MKSKDFPTLEDRMKLKGIGSLTPKTPAPGTYKSWKDARKDISAAESAYARKPTPENLKALQQASHVYSFPRRKYFFKKP